MRLEFAALARQPQPASTLSSPLDTRALSYGIAPEAMRRAVRAQAVRDVILPCSEALYATPSTPAREPAQALGASNT